MFDSNQNMLDTGNPTSQGEPCKLIELDIVNCFSSDSENGSSDEEEQIITGLTCFNLNETEKVQYLPKGPHPQPQPQPNDSKKPSSNGSQVQDSKGSSSQVQFCTDIPVLPDCNVMSPSSLEVVDNNPAPKPRKLLIVEPRLILSNATAGGYVVLPTKIYLVIHPQLKKLGFHLPRTNLSENSAKKGDKLELLFQPDPRQKRTFKCQASIDESPNDSATQYLFFRQQFVIVEQLVYKNKTGVETLLQDVSRDEVETAMKFIESHDSNTIFKTYGPNNDSLLMTLCCKRDDTPTIRAQVFAMATRILRETDPHRRQNLVMKNSSELSALDYTTVTNNIKLSVFLTEIFFALGQDVLCRDSSGNTLLHVMARKGDSVAPTLEALLSIKLRHDMDTKVFNSNVVNSKGLLPLHIAAMSISCPSSVLDLLIKDYERGLTVKTKDGSVPLHLACQYSTDPKLLEMLLCHSNSQGVNDNRDDGFAPIHLIASRNEAKDPKIGLMPIDEETQCQMIKVLLSHGADRFLKVEEYLPFHLLSAERTRARELLKPLPDFDDSSSISASEGFSADKSPPILSHPTPPLPHEQFFNRPTFSPTGDSETSHSSSNPYPTHSGSMSSVEGEASGQLDAIAHALINHPTIQAVIDSAAEASDFDQET